jgi:dTDP-4-dehydrorhamnose reductase
MVAIVTGGNGQLAQALRAVSGDFPEIELHFLKSAELDITKPADVASAFHTYQPVFCINTAAYTAVDKAESEP